MSFLYWLESIRTPFLNTLMSLITHIGEETVFLVIALLVLWCIDKKRGYILLSVGFLGTVINQFLKLTFRIPRPWVLDPNFTIVEAAREAASGYSFPSGHTQNTIDTFGTLARTSRRSWLRICCIAIILLVAFSRMYLGVHTLWDVGVSLAVGALLVWLVYPLLDKALEHNHSAWWLLGGMTALSLVFVLLTECYFPTIQAIDPVNLASGQSNAYTMLGCSLGILPVYAIDHYRLRFKTDAPLLGQIGKLIVGAVIAVAIKALLKQPLISLFGNESIARAVRYFILVVFAGALWPMTFPFWAKLGNKKTSV